ncbi:transcriptional regulator [Coriobacterium glomerans PW2]|uniref:Transcriptional regulator n=1 Tax=Coriobacterium glomerans (strain ATCC 49209 / DSM 20642 / JCM 10262 / PW2) TaxID=700015 RepID=F2N8K4_CORGP|nr:transcriptional regulator [Coriobacterium glomerans]AEB07387.1 transcriptional regulator [Coriobacterium glomerans PW2]
MSFSTALAAALRHKGLREADIVGGDISSSYISRLLSGQLREPTWPKACEIVDRLGMSLEEFRSLSESD